MSLRTLAGLSGLSAAFLSMVENGHRHLDRTGHINALAEALRVAPAELLGQPYPPAGPACDTAHEAVPAIRLTLMGAHPLQDSPPAAVMPTPPWPSGSPARTSCTTPARTAPSRTPCPTCSPTCTPRSRRPPLSSGRGCCG